MAVFKELLEPVVDLGRIKFVFVAQVRDGNLLQQLSFENFDFFRSGKMPPLAFFHR